MYSYGPPHMAEQEQDNQHEHTYSIYVRIQDVALNTCRRWWTIGRSGERGSKLSVLAVRHDDDDDDVSLLSSKHYKEGIKGKWSNQGKRVAPSPLHLSIEAIEIGVSVLPLTTVDQITIYITSLSLIWNANKIWLVSPSPLSTTIKSVCVCVWSLVKSILYY